MNILLIHQNFPGQFRHLAKMLVADGHRVVGLGRFRNPPIEGVAHVHYEPKRGTSSSVHPLAADFEAKVIRGEAITIAIREIEAKGFRPDLVYAHLGWGEGLFVKDVLPDVPLIGYVEFFYQAVGADVGFDPPDQPVDLATKLRVNAKNASIMLGLERCDALMTPTAWQRSLIPEPYQPKVSLLHEGIDTEIIRPRADVRMQLGEGGPILTAEDEVVTYIARNLEPYRGFHIFMRALPKILRERPNAQVLIAGKEGVSYGSQPSAGKSWKQVMLEEVGSQIDLSRVRFLGWLPSEALHALYQLSRAHIYLTYPFVLSWSMLEVMAAGGLVVGSRTKPVEEVIEDGVNGRLTDFFDVEALADRVIECCAEPERFAPLRAAARQTVIERYDLNTVTLPAYRRLIETWVGG